MATTQRSESAAVATTQRPQGEVERLITSEKARKFIEPFLPKGADIQRVAASVMLAMAKDDTGTLRKCTPQSLVLGVARIQQWGLELGTTAYLLPFKNKKSGKYEATPVADYKGLVELMIASKAVRYVEAREVREGDRFEYAFGLDAKIEHQPLGKSDRHKKPITHVYCIVHLPMSAKAFEVMTAEEVDAIRHQYSKQWKDGPLTAWYARKSIIRQVAKVLPKNPALARFFDVVEQDREVEVDAEITPLAQVTAASEADERPRVTAGATAAESDDSEASWLDDRWIEESSNHRQPGDES